MSVTFPLFSENIAEVLSQFRRYRPAIVAACRSPLPPPPTVPPPGPPHRTILRARDKPYTNAREKSVESRHVACRRRARTLRRQTTCAHCAACTDTGVRTDFERGGKTSGRARGNRRGWWRAKMTVVGPIGKLAGLAKACQRGAEGDRGDVARVSGSASRARRRMSILGGVARHRGRLRGPKSQSCCLRNPYGSVSRCGNRNREWCV